MDETESSPNTQKYPPTEAPDQGARTQARPPSTEQNTQAFPASHEEEEAPQFYVPKKQESEAPFFVPKPAVRNAAKGTAQSDKPAQGLQPGQAAFGRFILRHVLGNSHNATTWLADDTRHQQEVALKIFREADRRLNPEELRAATLKAAALVHPNIVRIYDFHSGEQGAAVSMEYLTGSSLTTLRTEQPGQVFEVSQLREYVLQICRALLAVHEEVKSVHRNIKPSNIFLTPEGVVKISEFGIATRLWSAEGSLYSSSTDGKRAAAYISPQQMRDDPAAVTDDIYSLGATLFELLTGKPVFYDGVIESQVMIVRPPSLTSRRLELRVGREPIPANWEECIAACLKKEPGARPQTLRELCRRLYGPEFLAAPAASSMPAPVLPVTVPLPPPASPAKPSPPAPEASPPKPEPTPEAPVYTPAPVPPSPVSEVKVLPPLSFPEPPPAPAPVPLPLPPKEVPEITPISTAFAPAAPTPAGQTPPKPRLGRLLGLGAAGLALLLLTLGLYSWVSSPSKPPPAQDQNSTGTEPATKPSTLTQTPSLNAKSPAEGRAWIVPDLGLTLVWVPPGVFALGSETGAPDERPVTRVTITKGFWLGKTEVTQKEYQALMRNNPSSFQAEQAPVEQVSWEDAMAFCYQLNETERAAGRLPAGYSYSLPTEAQWEYACRAGTTTAYAGDVDLLAWHNGNSRGITHAVAQKKPNAFGLYDMHGNVWEWCYDNFGAYPGGRVNDHKFSAPTHDRVYRGGSWDYDSSFCQSSFRGGDQLTRRGYFLGFRLALRPVQ